MAGRELKPCGTYAAAQRHRRKGEPVCDDCAQATRDQKNDRVEAQRKKSAESVAVAIEGVAPESAVDALEESRDSLAIIKAVLRSGDVPANAIAKLTERRDQLVDRIVSMEAERQPAEVSKYDEISARRRRRQSAA